MLAAYLHSDGTYEVANAHGPSNCLVPPEVRARLSRLIAYFKAKETTKGDLRFRWRVLTLSPSGEFSVDAILSLGIVTK